MATKKSVTLMEISVEEFYSNLDQWLRRFSYMNLARWKLLQNSGISLLVAYLAIEAGADPTVAVAVIALINGISVVELASIWGVSVNLRSEGPAIETERKRASESNDESETEQR